MLENYKNRDPKLDKCLKALVKLFARSIAKEEFENYQNLNKSDINKKKRN